MADCLKNFPFLREIGISAPYRLGYAIVPEHGILYRLYVAGRDVKCEITSLYILRITSGL